MLARGACRDQERVARRHLRLQLSLIVAGLFTLEKALFRAGVEKRASVFKEIEHFAYFLRRAERIDPANDEGDDGHGDNGKDAQAKIPTFKERLARHRGLVGEGGVAGWVALPKGRAKAVLVRRCDFLYQPYPDIKSTEYTCIRFREKREAHIGTARINRGWAVHTPRCLVEV